MKARIKNTAEAVVLYLDGKVDYETQDDVCDFINKTLIRSKQENVGPNKTDESPKNIILNFQNLEFVGSSGITQFVHSLKAIHSDTQITPKYCGVKSEFQKIIRAFDDKNAFEFFDDENLTKRNGKTIINN
jgi:anti-anti-sigma regulatory factor